MVLNPSRLQFFKKGFTGLSEGMPPTEVKIGMRVRAKVIDKKGAGLVVFTAEEAK